MRYNSDMENDNLNYDPRYLAGILFFNRQDYFEAHEVWESLWMDTASPEKRFYQALIQTAVALYHFGNGNLRGAAKLYRSSRDYMQKYDSPFLGIDAVRFCNDMERCFAGLHAEMQNNPNPDRHTLRLECRWPRKSPWSLPQKAGPSPSSLSAMRTNRP